MKRLKLRRPPTPAEIEAEIDRRGPPLDDSPAALERIVEVLIAARALPREVAQLLRENGIEVPDEAIYACEVAEPDNAASSQLDEDHGV